MIDLCRLCLNPSSNKIEIFGSVGQQMNISEMISILFNSQVLHSDCWPQHICMPCCEKLTEFHEFYSTVKSTEASLVGLCGPRTLSEETSRKSIEEKFIETCVESPQVEPSNDTLDFFHVTTDFPVNVKEEMPEMPESPEEEHEYLETSQDLQVTGVKDKEFSAQCKEQKKIPTAQEENMPSNAPKRKTKKTMDTIIAQFVKLTCEECLENFQIFEDLQKHYREEHNQEGYVVCCDIRFKQRYRLLDHVNSHRDPNKYFCKICKKSFKFRNSFTGHMDKHVAPEDKKFQCDQCPNSYNMLCRLKVHKKIHVPSEEREHVCLQCNTTYATDFNLRAHHKRVHEGKQRQVCEICAKVYNSREGFKLHMRRHTDQQRVKCQLCERTYADRICLRNHIESQHNTSNETYKCEICGRITLSKRALSKHKGNAHTAHTKKALKCNFCDKVFKKSLNLREHIATHTGQQSLYKCNFCDKRFNSNANRYSHQKRNHPEEWEEDRRKKLEKTSSNLL